jgi:predicted NAD/FAD-binding protein
MRVAIVGAGISGLSVAYRLQHAHDVTVFEANSWAGGHTHTHDVEHAGRHYAVDSGFIVFNHWTYPRFIALLEELGVASQPSDMSFSYRNETTGLEYNGTSLDTLFAQRRNLLRPAFLRMLGEILRFNRRARSLLERGDESLTLGEYLRRERYSGLFVEAYLVPMGKAIWSASERTLLGFPARFFVDFFDRHGFLNVSDRPRWRAVTGGSREYVRALTAAFSGTLRLETPIAGVSREASAVRLRTRRGEVESFDRVVLACHADQALALLADPSRAEREVLAAFPYETNEAALHTDTRLLPRTPRARAAWNYHALAREDDRVAVTYDMNVLQALDASTSFLVTLNRNADIEPSRILRTLRYDHPVYTPAGVAAQARRAELSGVNRTFYCGAYWRYGFHEDGVVSGEWVVEEFERALGLERAATGVPAPRAVAPA